MSEYLPTHGACCDSCSKLGDASSSSGVSFITILELGLAAFGAYALLSSKTVSNTLGLARSKISKRRKHRNRRRR